DRTVGADGEDDARVDPQVLAGDRREVGRRAAQVAELDAVTARQLDEPRVVAEEDVQAVLDVEAALDAGANQLDPLRREAAALRRDADERRRRAERQRLLDRADDRQAVLALARARGVEDGDDVVAAVAQDAAGRLAVVRVAGEALSEDEIALRLQLRDRVRVAGAGRRRGTRRRGRDPRRGA